jgi:hypothetical protein
MKKLNSVENFSSRLSIDLTNNTEIHSVILELYNADIKDRRTDVSSFLLDLYFHYSKEHMVLFIRLEFNLRGELFGANRVQRCSVTLQKPLASF